MILRELQVMSLVAVMCFHKLCCYGLFMIWLKFMDFTILSMIIMDVIFLSMIIMGMVILVYYVDGVIYSLSMMLCGVLGIGSFMLS